jgi:NTE family protein
MTTTVAVPASPFAELAVPRDFGAVHGQGLDRGLCLGGGGLFFVAWQVSYLHTLHTAGIDVQHAERVVGTSAGSLVATTLVGGHLGRIHAELSLLSRFPALLAALVPSADLQPSQLRALALFHDATDSQPDTIRSIGHAALAAQTPPTRVMPRNVTLIVGRGRWPSPSLHITGVDTYTGERCVVTHHSQVSTPTAVAASSAVPGLFSPQPIQDRRCMDGGVSGSGVHLDLLAGANRLVVLTLNDGEVDSEGMMTSGPNAFRQELEQLKASGTKVFLRAPTAFTLEELMSPAAVPKALTMGNRQALEDVEELTAFWS